MDFRISSGARRLAWANGVPAIGIKEIHGHNMRAKFLERKGQLTSIIAGLPHAQDATRANLDPRLFQVPDGLDALFIGVRGADLREEPLRSLQVMIVAFQTGLLETVGHLLALDHPQRGIRPRLAALLQFLQPAANLIERGPFIYPAPGSHKAQRR